MRIVAHNGARIWGGAERATTMLLSGLRDRGHDVLLLCNDELVMQAATSQGMRSEVLPIGGDIAIGHAFRLAGRLRQETPDAFIVGTWKKLFLAALGAKRAGVPVVVARVGLETDTPRSAKYRFALRHWVDGVAVNAERIEEPFAKLDGFGSKKVRVIHNGVRPPAPASNPGYLRSQLGIPPDAFVIGAVARLAQQKRLDRLLDSFALMGDDVHLIVAGEGPARVALVAKAAGLGLTRRAHFVGHRDDVADVLAALDVFAITSDREGMANSMLEAMAHGLPVVSTDVSGASDALEREARAGIITTFDPADIAASLARLHRDPGLRAQMSAAARLHASTTFSFETMLDRWEHFLAMPSR